MPASPNEGRHLISNGASSFVRFRRDGHQLLYFTADGQVMSVDLVTSPTLRVGQPKLVFALPDAYLRQTNPNADMMPDASRFLIPMPLSGPSGPAFHVLVNWR